MINFQHPTGRKPKTVTVLALGPTQQDFHSDQFTYDPQVPRADEVWLINKAFRSLHGDLVFVMDDLVGEATISPRYVDDLKNHCRMPIMTSIVDEHVRGLVPGPPLIEYPIHQVVDFWGLQWVARRTPEERLREQQDTARRDGRPIPSETPDATTFTEDEVRRAATRVGTYLRNSVPLILAYAGAIGVRCIHLFGADYDFPGNVVHEADKPNTEYWVGMLYGIGVELRMSSRTTLLSTNEGRAIYGYGKRQPRF